MMEEDYGTQRSPDATGGEEASTRGDCVREGDEPPPRLMITKMVSGKVNSIDGTPVIVIYGYAD